MQRLFKDEIIRDTAVVFIASSAVNLFNLFFQLYMLRNLTTTDYGILNSLLAVFIIISIPISTIQTSIITFVAKLSVNDQWRKIKYLLFNLSKKILSIAAIIFLIIVFKRADIASFLQISNYTLVIMLAVAMLFSAIAPIALGGLQGLQRFGYLGLSSVVSGGIKLILGVIFIKLGFGVMGSMSAFVVSIFIGFLLAAAPLIYFLRTGSDVHPNITINFTEMYKYFYPVAVVIFCMMVLTNIDIVLVKHFFDAKSSGLYSVAQIVGKIIFFLPGAVTIVMFPKSSKSHAQSEDTLQILKRSFTIVALMCGVVCLGCVLFPSIVMKLLAGKVYPESFTLVRLFALAMFPFALINLIVYYKLSIHRLKFIVPLVFFTILQVVLIVFFHNSLYNVLYIMLGNSIALLATLLILLKR